MNALRERMPHNWRTGFSIPLLFGLLSLLLTGFEYGTGNNVFHIPYVLEFLKLPQFANDPLYLSLGNFTSIIWPLVGMVADENNVEAIFLALHVASRCAAFVAIFFVLRAIGLSRNSGLIAAMAMVAVTPWLLSLSIVGRHGMFIGYFTQSEATWPTVIFAFLLFQREKFYLAALLAGLTFSINAFIGIWLLAILGILTLYLRIRFSFAELLRCGGMFLLAALPVILWIASSLQEKDQTTFSFIDYIRAYYKDHFLIEAASLHSLVQLGLLSLCGLMATRLMPAGRYWRNLLLAALTFTAVTTPLPYLIDHRLVFNLHLLRSDGLIQLLATVYVIYAIVTTLQQHSMGKQMIGATAAVLFASTPYRFSIDLLFAALLLLSLTSTGRLGLETTSRSLRLLREHVWLPIALLWLITAIIDRGLKPSLLIQAGILFLCFAYLVLNRRRVFSAHHFAVLAASLCVASCFAINYKSNRDLRHEHARNEHDWDSLTAWVRDSDLRGPFLVPLSKEADTFQLKARRVVWVDWKQGAAVMWDPAFYAQWMPRYNQVHALKDDGEKLEYARANHIPYLVTVGASCPPGSHNVHSEGQYHICAPN